LPPLHAGNREPIVQLPFKQLVGGVILVQAKLGHNPDTLNFILDTGSGGISLDSTTAQRLGLVTVASDLIIRGIAGMHKTRIVANETLHFPNLTIDSLDFHLSNYEMISQFNGEEIHGIIGYSVLKRFVVEIDYDQNLLRFYSKGSFCYPKRGFLLHPTIHKVPEQPCELRDQEKVSSKLLVDIGAGVCLMLSQEFAKKHLDMTRRKKLADKLIQGVGGTVSMQITVVKKLKVGKYKFHNVPAYLFDDVYQLTTYRKLAGLMGNDLLHRFNTTLNYGEEEIHLLPNSYFREPFDYAYSGLEVCAMNGTLFVCDLAKDSPADKAGLKVGDIILSVDNDFSQNLYRYKTALQKKSGTIGIIIQRNAQVTEYKVETIDIRVGK